MSLTAIAFSLAALFTTLCLVSYRQTCLLSESMEEALREVGASQVTVDIILEFRWFRFTTIFLGFILLLARYSFTKEQVVLMFWTHQQTWGLMEGVTETSYLEVFKYLNEKCGGKA